MPFPGQCIQVGQYMTCLHYLASGSKISCWLVYILQCRQSILLLTVNLSLFLYVNFKCVYVMGSLPADVGEEPVS